MGDWLDLDGGNDFANYQEKLKREKKNKKREAEEREKGKIPTLQIIGGIGSEHEIANRLNEIINRLNK